MEGFNIFCLIIPLIVLFVLAFRAYDAFWEKEYRRLSWQALVEPNHLTFVPGNWLRRGALVVGQYRGYDLKLESFNGNNGICTRIILKRLSKDNLSEKNQTFRGKQITNKDVAGLLTLDSLPHSWRGYIKVEPDGQNICYEQENIEEEIKYLQSLFEWLVDLADVYPIVLDIGGEAVPTLYQIVVYEYHILRQVAAQLLHDIGRETTARLASQTSLLCPRCFMYVDSHHINLPRSQSVTYYGCRNCQQSREFIEFQGCIIAVLDSQMTTEQVQQDGVLRVNWLTRRALFDFDEVEIVQATDEDVERFAVQVGNDTDPAREPRYQGMRCVVLPECHLSENTWRILQRMFGVVEMGPEMRANLQLPRLTQTQTTTYTPPLPASDEIERKRDKESLNRRKDE